MSERVAVKAYVDPEVRDRFALRFGDYGAISCLVESAMKEVLDMTEGQPDIEELFRSAIRANVLRNQFNPQRPSPNASDPA